MREVPSGRAPQAPAGSGCPRGGQAALRGMAARGHWRSGVAACAGRGPSRLEPEQHLLVPGTELPRLGKGRQGLTVRAAATGGRQEVLGKEA